VVDDGPARAVVSEHEPEATASPQIRRSLRALLTAWGVAEDVVDDAVLVVEELVANVVDHARTRFRLVVRLTGRVLRLAVRDSGAGLPQLQPFDPYASRGRGLQVVGTVAQRWGCDRHERGKTVWADLAV
jgi:anti-sigma regulatory factor (Ser/Thr protein kinase)